MNDFFREQFKNIHAIKLSDDLKERQRELEAYRLEIKYKIIPSLVAALKAHNKKANGQNISWAAAYREVQKLQIKYMGEFFKGSEVAYSTDAHPEKVFVSKQTPVGEFSPVYQRFNQGLAAWREYSFSVQGHGIPLLSLHIHASPVPYGEDLFGQRIEWTKNNFEQLLTHTGNKPLTEIRLLTPMPTPNKHFTTLSDYDQLLETAIAAELLNAQKGEQKKDILLFNYGTNAARRFAQQLQRLLNTRATTKLFDLVLVKLGKNGPLPNLAPLLETVPLNANEKITKKLFLKQLENQDKIHRETWKQQVAILNEFDPNTLTPEQQKILTLALEIIEMIQFDRWASEANKHRIQAALVELNDLLNRTVAVGCNDAKDRVGEQIAMLEARQIRKETECEVNKALVNEVLDKSTPEKVAPQISMPNLAHGRDTKGHPEKRSAGIFKRIYTMAQLRKFEAKDRWDARKEKMRERIEKCWPTSKPFYNFILSIMEWLADRNDPLEQKKSKKETGNQERRGAPIPVVEVNRNQERAPGIPQEDVAAVLEKVQRAQEKPGKAIPQAKPGRPSIVVF